MTARDRVRAPSSCSTRWSARPAWARRWRRSARASTSRWPTRSRSSSGGELVTQLAEATGRADHPRRLRALGAAPAHLRPSGPERSTSSYSPPAAGPFRGRSARGARGRERRGGPPAPDLGDGRQDHDRLGDADEQGPRADRGPSPVRHALRPHRRRRAPAVDRALLRRAVRRRGARAPRPPRHARADLLRAALPRPRRRPGPPARPGRGRRADLRAGRHRGVPLPAPGARGRRRRRDRAVRAERRQRGRRARVPRRAAWTSSASRRSSRRRSSACPPGPCGRSTRCTRPTARRAPWRPSSWPPSAPGEALG